MKATAFDAVLDFPLGPVRRDLAAQAVSLGGPVAVRLADYAVPGRRATPFVRALAAGPVDLKSGIRPGAPG